METALWSATSSHKWKDGGHMWPKLNVLTMPSSAIETGWKPFYKPFHTTRVKGAWHNMPSKGSQQELDVPSKCTLLSNVELLRKDLRNGLSRVFNDHTHCNPTFCKIAASVIPPATQTDHSNGVEESMATPLIRSLINPQRTNGHAPRGGGGKRW